MVVCRVWTRRHPTGGCAIAPQWPLPSGEVCRPQSQSSADAPSDSTEAGGDLVRMIWAEGGGGRVSSTRGGGGGCVVSTFEELADLHRKPHSLFRGFSIYRRTQKKCRLRGPNDFSFAHGSSHTRFEIIMRATREAVLEPHATPRAPRKRT